MLNDSSNEESKFATKKWYVIDSQTAKDKYNQSNSIKFESESIRSSLCDYSDAFILVTGDITGAPFIHARQKLMIFLLMMQITFTVRCLCTI